MLVAQHASRLSLALAAALTLGVLPGCSERSSGEAPEGPRLIDAPAATGCPHPLLPLIEGASWAYEVGADPGRTQTAELRVVRVAQHLPANSHFQTESVRVQAADSLSVPQAFF